MNIITNKVEQNEEKKKKNDYLLKVKELKYLINLSKIQDI